MPLVVEQRHLAQAEDHDLNLPGPHVAGQETDALGYDGQFQVFSARKGLTLSVFDVVMEHKSQIEMQSDPCIGLSILFEASGQGWIKDGDQLLGPSRFRPGFYCMIAPQGVSGLDELEPNSRFRGIEIRVSPELWSALGGEVDPMGMGQTHEYCQLATDHVWQGTLPLSSKVLGLAEDLYQNGRQDKSDLTVEARGLAILEAAIELLSPKPAQSVMIGPDQRAVKRVIALMESDLSHPWNVDELARTAGVPIKRLKKAFPAETGLPVYRFLQEKRLETAYQMLSDGGKTVTDVSLSIGFSSFSHFASVFRRRYGLPPSRVRDRALHQETNPQI